jgi:outer membrane protein assembly factor BamD (BamD/ComL family)
MKRLLASLALAAAVLVASVASAADTPPGWELRNGSWVPLVEPGTGSPEAQVAKMIRDLRAIPAAGTGAAQVVKDAQQWLKRNPRNPLMPQVLLIQGDAEILRGNKYAALYPFEDLLNNFPNSDLALATLEREYVLADAFLNGYKRKFLGLRVLPVTEDALTLLDRIQDRQRGSAIAEMAGLRKADYYYNAGKFPEAVYAYTDFLRRYQYSQYVRKAEIRRTEASTGNFHGVLFDFTPLYEARERLATISEAFSQTAEELQMRAIDDRIYQLEGHKELEIARYYYRAGKKYASAWYYKRVIANWPDTSMADAARKELALKLGTIGGGP